MAGHDRKGLQADHPAADSNMQPAMPARGKLAVDLPSSSRWRITSPANNAAEKQQARQSRPRDEPPKQGRIILGDQGIDSKSSKAAEEISKPASEKRQSFAAAVESGFGPTFPCPWRLRSARITLSRPH